ncbi:hypothetical protein HEBU111660_08275 [Helicobacter burdigaliensis]
MSEILLLAWPLVIYLSYRFVLLNITQIEKDENTK